MPDQDSKEMPQGPQEKLTWAQRMERSRKDRPITSRVIEPDPDYDPIVGYHDTRTPEEKQEAAFHETAKKLALEEERIRRLVKQYGEIPHSLRVKQWEEGFFIEPLGDNFRVISDNENIIPRGEGALQKQISLWSDPKNRFQDVADTDLTLSVPATIPDKYSHLKSVSPAPAAYYWFDSEGNYFKQYSFLRNEPQEMTADDFELAGSVLDGIKTKVRNTLEALGVTPQEDPNPQIP